MSGRNPFKQIVAAAGFATLSSLFVTTLASAQVANPPVSGPQIVRIDSPGSGARVHGNISFRGIAADCGLSQPATRVAVYDGQSTSDRYLADVSIDTTRPLQEICPGNGSSAQAGFTLIMDSHRLAEGRHTLSFVAFFSNGTAQTTTVDVEVDNIANRSVQYGPRYNGVIYGGYWVNGLYTPSYTQCIGWNTLGQCINYSAVPTPVVTNTVYPNCVTNAYGACVSYPYTYNPYTGSYTYPGTYNPYANYQYVNGQYYWNGVSWVLR
jgi:hypothetical protein